MADLRAKLFFSLASALGPVGLSPAQEIFYAIDNPFLLTLDPVTGEELSRVHIAGFPSLWGLGHDGARLVAVDRWTFGMPDFFWRLHPADASGGVVGPTGENWNLLALEVHPTTGIIYATWGDELFTIDPTTGAAAYQGQITGLKLGGCVCAMAIDSTGTCYGSGSNGSLYKVDLGNLTALYLGDITQFVGSGGLFGDLAFDGKDILWGSFNPVVLPTQIGLYKVDIQALSAQLVRILPSAYSGLAFGPGTPETTYCAAKTSSIGCLPTVGSFGLASPTAAFGYTILATDVRNNTLGMLVYTTAGRASSPFKGGTLCVNAPTRRAWTALSGGSPRPIKDCSGSWSMDFNSFLTANPGLPPGTVVNCQWFGRDGGYPPSWNISLSDALELTLRP